MTIELKAVKFAYNSEMRAIDGADAVFSMNGVYAVIGRNGSGKSTLLKLMAGLLKPQSGEVSYDGSDAASLGPRRLALLRSYVPQNLFVRSDFTVWQFISFGLFRNMGYFAGLSSEESVKVEEMMKIFEIDNLKERRIWEISGGELQKAHVARALIQDTPAILMDEPVSSIDLDYKFRIMKALKKISEKKTVILVMHDIETALNYADRIVALKSGRVENDGSPDETAAALNRIYDRKFVIERVRDKYVILDEEGR